MSTLQRRRMMMAQGVTYDGTPLMITNVGDEPIEVSLRFNALRKTEPPIIYYNTTGKKSYKKWDLSNITLAKGGTLYLFGENSVVDSTFVVNGNSSIHVDGKLEALLQGQVGTVQFGNYALEGLFKDVTQLESVGDIMPQVIGGVNAPSGYSTGYRYSSLFENTGIVEIPDNFLKETTISNPHSRLYNRMFFGCTKLTTIPRDLFINQNGGSGSIGATYYSMFQDCSNLEVAADLYIQTQGFQSAYSMYRGCKKITDVKVFTKTLANNHCMQYFVADCDNLQSIDFDIDRVTHWGVLANAMLNCKNLTKVSIKVKTWNHEQTITDNGAYSNWMKGVSPTGTFTCPKELAEATDGYYDEEGNFVKGVGRGGSSVPAGWDINYPIIDARDGDTNAMALLTALVEYGLCPRGEYLMNSEADAIVSINSVFKGNTQITDFTAFQFFNGIKDLGAGNEATSPFAGSTLTRIILPDTLNIINNYAFYNCSALEYVSIGKNITTISDRAFYLCKNLSRADYRGTLEGWLNINIWWMGNPMVVGADLYINGELLAGDIVIPESITYIKQRILEGGKYITSITINHEINSIELNAFAGCSSLAYIVLNSNTPPKLQSSAIPSQTIIYVPDDSFDTYKSANVWSTIASRIKPISELPQE